MLTTLPADITALPFEEALSELEALVRRMESGTVKLDEAVADYARGMQLRAHCAGRLEQARLRVEQISTDGAGGFTLTAFAD